MQATGSELMRIAASGTGEVALVEPVDRRAAIVDSIVELGPTLLATARFLVRGDAEARDLAQATMEIGLRKIDDLRDPTRLRGWLLAIEAREAGRIRRRLRRLVSLDAQVGQIGITSPPDDRAIALRHGLERLPPRIRTAVVLHHLSGLTVAETADAMDVSVNTVKSELQVGLSRLREGLDESLD
jgi:RNA polymerase sigma-70 factor, ECF subfamily